MKQIYLNNSHIIIHELRRVHDILSADSSLGLHFNYFLCTVCKKALALRYIKSQKPNKRLNTDFYNCKLYNIGGLSTDVWWVSNTYANDPEQRSLIIKEKKRFLKHIIDKLK